MRAQKYLVLPDEDAAEFEALEAALIEELAPIGALQAVPARRIAVAAWRLARADRIEAEPFAERHVAGGGPGLALIRGPRVQPENLAPGRSRRCRAIAARTWPSAGALRTLKALQAEQALATGPAVPAHPMRPTARPPLVHRPQPDEPERDAAPRLEYVLSEPPAPDSTLHEPAAPWLPSEPETGRARHAASMPAFRTNPEPHSSSTRPEGGESCPSPRLTGSRTNPSPVEVGAGPEGARRIAAPIASRRDGSAS